MLIETHPLIASYTCFIFFLDTLTSLLWSWTNSSRMWSESWRRSADFTVRLFVFPCFCIFKPLCSRMNRNGIYPLMNFASQRPHPIPRALSLSQEQMETVKTPTPEPQETETRKVRNNCKRSQNHCSESQFILNFLFNTNYFLIKQTIVKCVQIWRARVSSKNADTLNISQK